MSSNEIKLVSIPDTCKEIVLCGGPYNNYEAVNTFLQQTSNYVHRFCLGDLGGFGPFPDRTIELLKNSNVQCIQGNYDYSVGNGENECGCGYLDPRDRHFAQVSFDYTFKNTSEKNKPWLRSLPPQIELTWRGKKILLCHGSPDEVNEFVWESETSDEKINTWLQNSQVDGICATHSGIPWTREIAKKGFWMNVGVLGRPAHEKATHVYYASIRFENGTLSPQLHTLNYNYLQVVQDMRSEKIPEEFCQALLVGPWTTCLQILPPTEKSISPRLNKLN